MIRLKQVTLCGGVRNPLIGMRLTVSLRDQNNLETSLDLTQIGTLNDNCTSLVLNDGEAIY